MFIFKFLKNNFTENITYSPVFLKKITIINYYELHISIKISFNNINVGQPFRVALLSKAKALPYII